MGFLFNIIQWVIKVIIKLSLYLAVFVAVIVLIPNLPPYTKFTSIELEETLPRVGPLAPNDLLNNVESNFKGKLLGPEAFELFNGELFTSLATGEIVKVSPQGHLTYVTKIGQPCSGLTKEHVCGRPLGFQIDPNTNSLYVADAYLGIWKVNLNTDKKQLLVSPRVAIEQRTPKLFNSIALEKNGNFYWTDSSSDFELRDGAMGMLSDPSGRLFYYNAAKNESKVLLDDLWFANGLALSPNSDFVIVAETARYRLLKYYVAGPKKGKSEVFVAGIPGAPDNLRVLPDGSGILVGLYTVFDDENPLLLRSVAATPVFRKFLVRLQRLIEIPFEYLNTVYPHYIFEEITHYIGNFMSVSFLSPDVSGLMQVDWNGNIVATYYNTDKSVSHISDGVVFNEKLYTGCPHVQDFIGVVPAPQLLKNAFTKKHSSQAKEANKIETKPVEQAPRKSTQEAPKVEKPIVSKVEPKVEQKPKVETKVEQQKPKVEPKVEQKPKVEPKVEQKPKVEPKVEQKPKVEPKVEPKVAQKVQETPKQAEPKPTVQPKQAEPVKPTQKPVDKKPSVESKPQAPKTTPPPAPKTVPTQKSQPRQAETTTSKPEIKTTPPPKPTEKTTTPPPPKTTQMPASQPKTPEAKKPIKEKSAEGKAIPIKEEIKSDTARPKGETLKVIKKGGPTEIPAPNL